MQKKSIILLFIVLQATLIFAQATFINKGNIIVNGDVHIVLENTNWQNDGTFSASNGTVNITGNATQSNSSIGGTNSTEFYKLTINKSSNNAQLGQITTVTNQLTLTQGKLSLENYNLVMAANAGIVSSTSNYIQTSGTGQLGRIVSSGGTNFPVGKSTYTPLYLVNNGTSDVLYVRVENTVLTDGTSGTQITTDIVNTSWFVDENIAGGSDLTMTATWNSTDEGTNFDRNNCYISHYTNGVWDTNTTASATGTNPYSITRNGITTLSPFTVADISYTLPLELLNFDGKAGDNIHTLFWQTANEEKIACFELQQSENGIDFKTITRLAAKNKQSNQYLFDNKNLLQSDNYYRLKIVEADGKVSFSNIIILENRAKESLILYPNPTTGALYIRANNTTQPVTVFNEVGSLIFSAQSTPNQLEMSHLPSGSYLVKIGEKSCKVLKY